MIDGGERKKWLDRLTDIVFVICIFVVVYFVLQVFVLTFFRIPSDSMRPVLLPGDCIPVDKCSGGARLFNVLDAVDHKEVKSQTTVKAEVWLDDY